jgi:hypothetical protein
MVRFLRSGAGGLNTRAEFTLGRFEQLQVTFVPRQQFLPERLAELGAHPLEAVFQRTFALALIAGHVIGREANTPLRQQLAREGRC